MSIETTLEEAILRTDLPSINTQKTTLERLGYTPERVFEVFKRVCHGDEKEAKSCLEKLEKWNKSS